MKKSLMIFIILINGSLLIANEASATEVPILLEEEETNHIYIPTLSKTFPGAKNREEKARQQEKCQLWVRDKINELEGEKVFKFWCSLRKDVIIREYVFTGKVLLKNW